MVKNKLLNLRYLFKDFNINGYLLSTKDEYLSEYPPPSAKRLEYLTGFTGSNGTIIVLENTALFFTDGRYITQATKELDKNLFQVFNQNLLSNFPWEKYAPKDIIIGYDPRIFTNNSLLPFKKLHVKAVQENLIDQLWQGRPSKPNSKIYNYDIAFAGVERSEKIAKCRNFLKTQNAAALIITNPETVCWLFNIRAADIEFSPLLLANACITLEKAYLFTDITRIKDPLPEITILPEERLINIIQEQEGKILFDDIWMI